MALLCEDLAGHGVVLIPPGPQDVSGPAILHNQAGTAIASITYIWTFSGRDGRIFPHSCLPGTNPSVLLPFGLEDRFKKIHVYRNTIFPGSKRLMMPDGSMSGDNTDVRPPDADEVWEGGYCSVGGRSTVYGLEPSKLTLDGVFFVDGGFAGPNRLGTWEQTVLAAEAYLDCARLAREAHERDFFVKLQALTGSMTNSRGPC